MRRTLAVTLAGLVAGCRPKHDDHVHPGRRFVPVETITETVLKATGEPADN
ncbi:MAG: hypothetical protein K8U57_37615 [Planctomycetes bacterium]|nr:hypothetical protein [Planctomycetota bacterium]